MSTNDVLTVADRNAGLMNLNVDDPLPTAGTRYYSVLFNDGSDPRLSAVFDVSGDGMQEGMWLSPMGEVRSSPCAETTTRASWSLRGASATTLRSNGIGEQS